MSKAHQLPENKAHNYRKEPGSYVLERAHCRATIHISTAAQLPQETKLSNKNNCLRREPTNKRKHGRHRRLERRERKKGGDGVVKEDQQGLKHNPPIFIFLFLQPTSMNIASGCAARLDWQLIQSYSQCAPAAAGHWHWHWQGRCRCRPGT